MRGHRDVHHHIIIIIIIIIMMMMLFLSLLVWPSALAYNLPNCREPPTLEFPDVAVRCDKAAECTEYCARNQLSLDWLCCEDGKGWVAAHALNPLTFYMFWQDPVWTALVVLLFEVFEVVVLTLTGQFLVFPTAPTELETWSGSLLGDGLIQGGLGLWIGALIHYVFAMPRLVSTPALARANGGRGWRAGRIVLWAVHTTFFLIIAWAGAAEHERYGLWLSIGLQVLFVGVLYPWIFFSRDDALTRRMLGGGTWSSAGFVVWALVVATLGLATAGWQWLANDWFQVWLVAAVWTTVLTAAAVWTAATRRRDGRWAVVWLSVYALAAALALAVAGRAFIVEGVFLAALPVLVLGILACVCRTQIPDMATAKRKM